MKYPIDPDKYITALHLLYGPDVNENVYRKIIPAVNDCYGAGLRGEGGFPITIDELALAAMERLGCGSPVISSMAYKLSRPIVEWYNQAYAQGRQDAEKEGLSWDF